MKRNLLIYTGLGVLGLAVAAVGVYVETKPVSAAGSMPGMQAGPMMMAGGFGDMGFGGQTPAQAAAAQATEFQNEASATGLSLSVITSGWAQGESIQQIATANGVSAAQLKTDMQNFAQSELKAELDAMVSNGTITQDQENARLSFLQTEQTKIASATSTPGMAGKWGGRGRGPRTSTSTSSTSTN